MITRKDCLQTKTIKASQRTKSKCFHCFLSKDRPHIAAFFRLPHSASLLASFHSPSFGCVSFRCSFHYASHATPFFVISVHAAILLMKKYSQCPCALGVHFPAVEYNINSLATHVSSRFPSAFANTQSPG